MTAQGDVQPTVRESLAESLCVGEAPPASKCPAVSVQEREMPNKNAFLPWLAGLIQPAEQRVDCFFRDSSGREEPVGRQALLHNKEPRLPVGEFHGQVCQVPALAVQIGERVSEGFLAASVADVDVMVPRHVEEALGAQLQEGGHEALGQGEFEG